MTDFLDAQWRYPHAVSSVLVSGPDEEPLTLAEGKLRPALEWPPGDPRDDLMTGFIAAARHKVELDTGLALLRQTRDITLRYDPSKPIPLPMQALPLLAIVDPSGRRLDPSMYVLDRTVRTIRFAPSAHVAPFDLCGPLTWRIESGWPDKAALAREAPLLVHAVGLLTAHFATLGRDLASIDESFEVPAGYVDAIAPFVQVWVT